MPKSLLATVTLAATNGLVADATVNSFAFLASDAFTPATQGGFISQALASFYNLAPTGVAVAIGTFLNRSRSRAPGQMTFRIYDVTGKLQGQPHGSPIFTDSGTLVATNTGGSIPSEVAVVLTLRAGGWSSTPVEAPDGSDPDLRPDRPRERKTGRIFFGPLHTGAMEGPDPVDGYARPRTILTEGLRAAYKDMVTSLSTYQINPSVWSRKDGIMRSVSDVQTDNAFDTQRRRGIAPSARATTYVL